MDARRKLLLAAVTLSIVMVAGGLWVAGAREQPSAPPRPGQARPSSSATSGGADPAAASAGLVWADFGGMALPSSPHDGPRHRDGGLVSGFARTPRGALLAAVNIGVRSNAQWGPAVYVPTINQQVIGPDQPTLLAATRSFYSDRRAEAGIAYGQPLGRAYVVVEAFRWQNYSRDSASLDLVTAGPGNGGTTARAATRMQLQWRDDDWRVLAPPGGDWGNAATPIDELSGFTTLEQG